MIFSEQSMTVFNVIMKEDIRKLIRFVDFMFDVEDDVGKIRKGIIDPEFVITITHDKTSFSNGFGYKTKIKQITMKIQYDEQEIGRIYYTPEYPTATRIVPMNLKPIEPYWNVL